MKISEHFDDREFRCKCGKCSMPEISKELLTVLELIRSHFKGKVIVVSGYRCKEHNMAVGGATNSQHCLGIAADIQVTDDTGIYVPPRHVANWLDAEYPSKYGIGRYKTWTHIDVRPNMARWVG